MSTVPTEPQDDPQRRRSQEMSRKKAHPPVEVPGYEPEKFLGGGAYGEVWVAREGNTGRRVAIKFYAHRGGLDWSLLSREVEKLAFLFADRYVVQLLGVGWDSDPPYYIMEYLSKGSLAERLDQGPMAVDEAVSMFRDVATGLLHAHGKGVLHCDLKPANILLDEDDKPRLADFGQSRLSDDQTPALGTLYYMAPEQADLEAVPDARWDVYALGALLYRMLTGDPPSRSDEAALAIQGAPNLPERLACYRRTIEESPPSAHRQVRGIDYALTEIIDRCLAPDPAKRFPNVQAVLEALDLRAARRARLPLTILGAIGPALLLAVITWFAWQGFSTVVQQSDDALTHQVLDSNGFAAQYVARTAANELEKRFEAVEKVSRSESFHKAIDEMLLRPEVQELLAKLNDPDTADEELKRLREQFRKNNPERAKLQRAFAAFLPEDMKPPDAVASWFYCDPQGLSTVRVPESQTIGVNFAFRSYFHGGPKDFEESWRPSPGEHVHRTQLSAVFRSQATHRWIVAVTTPVFDRLPDRKFLGVVALTVEVGRFAELKGRDDQFAVLVDCRKGDNEGVILQHPLFDKLLAETGKLPDRFKDYRVEPNDLPNDPAREQNYTDPMEADPEGSEYDRQWLARMEPVRVRGNETGWVVIVQEAYATAIGSTLQTLTEGLIRWGLLALLMVALIMVGLWGWATRWSGK